MRKLVVFNNITLDGYFTGKDGDFGWAHGGAPDPEFDAFVAGNASGSGQLLFGRKTYDIMAGYWPTPLAAQQNPEVARGMNAMPKVVFSRTMQRAAWGNTTVAAGDLVETVRRMKGESGPDMVILGSGSIVAQLAPAGVIDEYQVVVSPVVLGGGRTMFEGVPGPLNLTLSSSRTFPKGKVFLSYAAAG
jgi:dihydrofolate reductase